MNVFSIQREHSHFRSTPFLIFMSKFYKYLLISLGALLVLIALIILFISPIAKYLIEKYDEKYTGRQIKIDWVYVNPFTGYVHLSKPIIYEFKSDSAFFSAQSISLNFSVSKIFFKTIEIAELRINHPKSEIIRDSILLNITDLIETFTPDKPKSASTKSSRFNILKIKITDGDFLYRENLTHVNYLIKNVYLESPGLKWNEDTISVHFSLVPGSGGGSMKGDFTINLKNNDYRIAAVVQKFDLNIINQYLKDLSNYGVFSANFDFDFKASGNFNDGENINLMGKLAINDFHFGKSKINDYISFKKFSFGIIELGPKSHKYLFDSVTLDLPYFKYERYDNLDNFETMFGKQGENISSVNNNPARFNLILEIARYVKVLARNFFQSQYKINHAAINKGDLKFNDYSLGDKFSIDLNPLTILADSIDKSHKLVHMEFSSGIIPYGKGNISLNINPRDTSDFDIKYSFKNLPASLFNPYTIAYTSFPLDKGTIEFYGTWKVRNGQIQSDNHLLVLDPRVTKRIRNKDTKWLPMPLIMSFIRERGNVIDYEIPITGNLRNPKFHLKDIVFDLLENIFVKPATTPYRTKVKNLEREIEKSLTLKWEMRQHTLNNSQEGFVKKMADFLVKYPKTDITVLPQLYAAKEKEYILFYEAKKKYFMHANSITDKSFTEADSEKINKLSVKDTVFVRYLEKQTKDSLLFSIQEKCYSFVDSSFISNKYGHLNKERKEAFLQYFTDKGVINQVHFSNNENVIPYNGFSFYKIEYQGQIPEALLSAYSKMRELNDLDPRKEFESRRKNNYKE